MEQDIYNLQRFLVAQDKYDQFNTAVKELLEGRKRSHWIWYIFPQVKGLGFSYNSNYYGIGSIEEARAYLEHPELGNRLRRVTEILIQWAHKGKNMQDLLGGIDALKTKSSLTLFELVSPDELFATALEECFAGIKDDKTVEIYNSWNLSSRFD